MDQSIFFYFFILLAGFRSSYSQRRIKDGLEVMSDKNYAVYLLRAESEPNQYTGWLCGGAILSKDYVITSAACVQDVQHLYVIAGYKKYVASDKLNDDKCTVKIKKKVVLTCVPRNYHLDYNKTDVWAKADIAVVKVESSFDFEKAETECSYAPQKIEFNTEAEFPKTGDDVIAMGWGHNKEFRKDSELGDLNQATLHYVPTTVMETKMCAESYGSNPSLAAFITFSMICTLEPGNLNDEGQLISTGQPNVDGCLTKKAILRGAVGRMCQEHEIPEDYEEDLDGRDFYDFDADKMSLVYDGRKYSKNNKMLERRNDTDKKKVNRRNFELLDILNQGTYYDTHYTGYLREGSNEKPTDKPENKSEETKPQQTNDVPNPLPSKPPEDIKNETTTTTTSIPPTTNTGVGIAKFDEAVIDLPGICQNDHGGPLVAWRGGKEILVGIATLFKLDSKQQCRGPYLFTKTWCNGVFLNCIVYQENKDDTRRRHCDDPDELGFEIIRRHISWADHKDGPAENERIQIRHQVPMSAFQPNSANPVRY